METLLTLATSLAADSRHMLLIAGAVLFAGFIRGFGGFGFALAAVPLLTIMLPPLLAIPIVLVLEVILTLLFLPRVWPLVEWQSVSLLALGACFATPLGIWLLSTASPMLLRLALGIILLVSVYALWTPAARLAHRSGGWAIATGAVSGLLSGGTAMSGPPVILYYMNDANEAPIRRASMMMFFLFSAGVAVAWGMARGIYSPRILLFGLLLSPVAAMGAWLGSLCFHRTGAATYRTITLAILALIGLYTIGSEMLHILQLY